MESSVRGQRVGYIRVSSYDQNPERQLEDVAVDRTFTEKASGKDTQQPQLQALMAFVRAGDTVIVHSMDRLARNLDNLRRIVQTLTQRGIRIEFVKEQLAFTGDDSPAANLMLSVMGAVAESERAAIRERQREGIALAKQRGVYRGRKPSLSLADRLEVRLRIEAGQKKARVARDFGISRETLYQYLRAMDGRPRDFQGDRKVQATGAPTSKIASSATFEATVKHLFRHLYVPRALRGNALVQRYFKGADAGRKGEAEALARIHQAVRQGAARCRDADLHEGKDERALRQHTIVTLQCLERRPIREVAATLGISSGHCYRERADICQRIARYIVECGDATTLDYFPELDEFRFLANHAAQRAASGEAEAALRESDDLVRVAPSPRQKIEALHIRAFAASLFGDVERVKTAHAMARWLFTESLACDPSASRNIAQACIDLIGLCLAANGGQTKEVLRLARRATSRLEPVLGGAPAFVRELYAESTFILGIALANLGNLEAGYDSVARSEAAIARLRPASAHLRSWIMAESWRLRNRLLMSSAHWKPSWQRKEGLAKAFEVAYTSGALTGAIRALVSLTEHHAFATNDAEALHAARSAVLLAKHSGSQLCIDTSIAVALPLLSTQHWEQGIALLPATTRLSCAAYHGYAIAYCNAVRALRTRAFQDAWALATGHEPGSTQPGLEVRMRLIAAAAAHELGRRREARTLIEESVTNAEELSSAPILRDAYGLAAKVTGDAQFSGRAREITRLLTA